MEPREPEREYASNRPQGALLELVPKQPQSVYIAKVLTSSFVRKHPVPRYFFHIRQGDERVEDFEGTELIDLPAALLDGLASAREIVGNRIIHGNLLNDQTFEICDASGLILAMLPFTDAFKA